MGAAHGYDQSLMVPGASRVWPTVTRSPAARCVGQPTPLGRAFRNCVPRPAFEHRESGEFMGLFSKDIATMDDLLLHGLKDIYYAENQIIKSLPKLIEKATNRDLSRGLKDHLEETKNQVGRLDVQEA